MVKLEKKGHDIDIKNIVIHKIDKVKGNGNTVVKCNPKTLNITETEKLFIVGVM